MLPSCSTTIMLHELGITPELLITQIVGFIIFLYLLHVLFSKPLFGFLDQRRADIQESYDQLDRDRESMEDAKRQYQERLAGIEAEAREKIQAAIVEAQELRATMIAEAQKQADAIMERGRADTERERQKAFLETRQQMVNLAVAAAGKVIGETLNDARHTKLVDDFIANVGTGAFTASHRGTSGSTGVSNA